MRIIFVGTSSFGIPVLKKIISLGEKVIAIITQPDRPAGRGKRLQISPIKEVALEYGLNLLQPEDINSEGSIETIKELSPDLIILIAYGQILSGKVLEIPNFGCLNVHPSLLPHYKGSAPIQWSIMRGEKETGISFLFMNEKIDSGDIILQKKVKILPGENYQELSKKLSLESAEMIAEIINNIKQGCCKKISQPTGKYFYARKIEKEDCQINWNNSGIEIINLIRGIAYSPCAFTEFNGKRIKITRASFKNINGVDMDLYQGRPGEILNVSKKGIQVLAGDNTSVLITRLIFPGSNEMDVSQFISGHNIEAGDMFS